MNTKVKIPVKNIYYMLCYAWDILTPKSEELYGKEKFDNIYNLLARILAKSIEQLLKRGFHREYINEEGPLTFLRGKILMQQSLQQQTIMKKQLVCNYDQLSPDVKFNQIIKAAMRVLLKSGKLDGSLKKELAKPRPFFAHISDLYPSEQDFATLHFNRNNQNYRLIMNTCRLIFEGLISNENDREIRFADFIKDDKMAKLYEKFVFNFYHQHLPKNEYHVHSPKIEWDLNYEHENSKEYLPEMRTDIVLDNNLSNTQLIIDTKYYSNTLIQGYNSTKKVVQPANLYQIYAYINNSSFSGQTMGMLLYPTVTERLDLKYHIHGKPIMVKTLNLSDSWESLEQQLIDIVSVTNQKSVCTTKFPVD